jgi:hypothetical protein
MRSPISVNSTAASLVMQVADFTAICLVYEAVYFVNADASYLRQIGEFTEYCLLK